MFNGNKGDRELYCIFNVVFDMEIFNKYLLNL